MRDSVQHLPAAGLRVMEWLGIEELRMPECLSAFYPDDSYGLQLPEHSGTRCVKLVRIRGSTLLQVSGRY